MDYSRINALTTENKYPLPVIDKLLDELNGATWFTSLDLCQAFTKSGWHMERNLKLPSKHTVVIMNTK